MKPENELGPNPNEIYHLIGVLYYIYITTIVSGWWLSPTPLKNHGVRQWVSDDIQHIMENKIDV